MNLTNDKPIFLQVKDYFLSLIEKGALKNGDMLPSVRDVARFYGINPNTVHRAYSLLVEEGYVVALSKKGYIVEKKENDKGMLLRKEIERLLLIYKKEDILKALEESNDD